MTETEIAMLEKLHGELKFLLYLADEHLRRYQDKSIRFQQLLNEAEQENNHDQALVLGGWIDALKESERYAGYMRRDVASMKDRIKSQLPVRPRLTLVVDNKKAPAATGAQHIGNNASENYDRNP